ncbi:MAG TPA: ABC transporter substrate-binding protein [Candidatus Limnocylindria bacterium]|nr:ABC transporter substrate-binding protein [Candidatus Limnocylindria bacterium]
MRLYRFAALAATAVFLVGCSNAGSATNAPTTAATNAATTAPASIPPATAPAATETPIAAPTSLITAGTLTACVDIEYPPLEYFASADITDPNQAIGFDVDGAKAVAAKLGLALVIKNTGFEALIPDLGAGRCDIVWSGLYDSAERREVADSVPYLVTGHVVMVAAGNPAGIKAETDLCGKTISVQSGGLVAKRAQAASDACTTASKAAITIQSYPEVADELQQIVLGRVDAVWETDDAVAVFMAKNPGKYEVGFAFTPDDKYAIYYTKGKADLGTALTAALSALKADGTLAQIAGTYAIDPARLEPIQ